MTQAHPFDQMLETYVRWGEPVSKVFAWALLDRAGLAPRRTVLDSCAGAGALALIAAEAGHAVEAIDLAPGMLALLTDRLARYPGSSATQMDALAMTYADDTFDASFSVLGVTNFGDKLPAAVEAMVRVTKPGGTIGLAHWASTWGSPIFAIMAAAMERLDEPEVEPLVPLLPGDYMTPAALDDLLAKAGCVDVSTSRIATPAPLPEPDVAFDELDKMYILHPRYAALDGSQRERLRASSAEEISKVRAPNGDGPDSACHLTIGRVPSTDQGSPHP